MPGLVSHYVKYLLFLILYKKEAILKHKNLKSITYLRV